MADALRRHIGKSDDHHCTTGRPSAERCTPCRRRTGTFAITAVPVPLSAYWDPYS
jgi:hypothetical protein